MAGCNGQFFQKHIIRFWFQSGQTLVGWTQNSANHFSAKVDLGTWVSVQVKQIKKSGITYEITGDYKYPDGSIITLDDNNGAISARDCHSL